MAVKDKFADEILSDEELDNVTGGTIIEMIEDAKELYKRGLLSTEIPSAFQNVCDVLHKMGYVGCKYNFDINLDNIYTDKAGNRISREKFWQNFDAENGTKIIQ